MAKWDKRTLKLSEAHGWHARPGFKIFVADRGASVGLGLVGDCLDTGARASSCRKRASCLIEDASGAIALFEYGRA